MGGHGDGEWIKFDKSRRYYYITADGSYHSGKVYMHGKWLYSELELEIGTLNQSPPIIMFMKTALKPHIWGLDHAIPIWVIDET